MHNSARPILRIWGVLVNVATIITYVLLIQWNDIIKDAVGENLETEHCNFNSTLPKLKLRSPGHAHTTASEPVFGYFYNLIVSRVAGLVLMPVAFGLITCLLTIAETKPSTNNKISPCANQGPYDQAPIAEVSDAGRFYLFSAAKNGFVLLRKVALALTPLCFIPTLVINEMYLLQDGENGEGIPGAEKMYEVGQWGLFVGAGFVAAAALVNSISGRTKSTVDRFGIEDGITSMVSNDGVIK